MKQITEDIRFDVKCLNLNQFYDAVIKELGIKKLSSLELGVMEKQHPKKNRLGQTVTTVQVAAGQEFGNSMTPPRPFLAPSANRFVKSDFSKDVKQEYTYLGSFLKRLARKLYQTVIECFFTNGFGKWTPLSDRYMKETGRTPTPMLVDTGTLFSSVYVKYEGYTISGKMTGGVVGGITEEEDKRFKEIRQTADKMKADMANFLATVQKSKERPPVYYEEKRKTENTEEAIRAFYNKRVKKRYKNEMSIWDAEAKRSELEDWLVDRELRKRKLI